MKNVALAVLVTFVAACAPHHAAKIRDDDPITVGIMGVQYRPTPNLGLSFTAITAAEARSVGNKNDDYANGRELLARNATRQDTYRNLDLLWYPFLSSGFFLGIGAGSGTTTLAFDEYRANANRAVAPGADGWDGESLRVEYRDNYLSAGPAIGWTWIWESGITLHLDVGPRWHFDRKRVYLSGGDGSGVDQAERNRTLRKANSVHTFDGENHRAGNALVGFSF